MSAYLILKSMGEETQTNLSQSECYVASKVGVVPSALRICMWLEYSSFMFCVQQCSFFS